MFAITLNSLVLNLEHPTLRPNALATVNWMHKKNLTRGLIFHPNETRTVQVLERWGFPPLRLHPLKSDETLQAAMTELDTWKLITGNKNEAREGLKFAQKTFLIHENYSLEDIEFFNEVGERLDLVNWKNILETFDKAAIDDRNIPQRGRKPERKRY